MAAVARRDGLPAAVEVLAGARTDDAMFVVGPDRRIVYWDAGAEFLTGLVGAEVVGKPLCEAVAGEREDGTPFCRCGCPVMRLARAGRPVPSYEVRLYSPAGKKRWVSVTVLSVDAEEGPYLINLLRDSQRMHDTLEMARALIRRSNGDVPGTAENTPELTTRQLEVLRLLSEGKSARGPLGESWTSRRPPSGVTSGPFCRRWGRTRRWKPSHGLGRRAC